MGTLVYPYTKKGATCAVTCFAVVTPIPSRCQAGTAWRETKEKCVCWGGGREGGCGIKWIDAKCVDEMIMRIDVQRRQMTLEIRKTSVVRT